MIKLAAAIPTAVVVSLGAGTISLPAAAVAAPPPTQRFAEPKTLKDALLTVGDLPKGYMVLDGDFGTGALADMFDPGQIGGNPCEPAQVLKPEVPRPEVPKPDGPKPAVTKPAGTKSAVTKPAGTKPATLKFDAPEPLLEMVGRAKNQDKDKVKLEVVAFLKGESGPVLLEALAGTGRKLARELVADTREMLERCPTAQSANLKMAMSPMPKFAKFGDSSAALSMIITVDNGGISVAVFGKMIVVAFGKVYATVAMVGETEPADAELKKITKTALRKLKKVA